MADYLNFLADPAPYMPHGLCLLWDPVLIWTHLVSDALTAGAYYSIPLAILVFVKRRKDLAYRWIFVLFALFILACGTTHLLGAWTLWQPVYVLEGAVKAVTAAVSVVTAVVLWPLLPRAVALPSPGQLRAANEALRAEVQERKRAEHTAVESNIALENAMRALKESEARYASIFNNTSDVIFTVDVLPDGTFRYGSTNPAFDRETGIRGADIIGKTPREAMDPRYADGMEARYAACVAARMPTRYEEVTEKSDSVKVWQTALVPVIDPATGHVVQLVGTSRDMTAYRALQEELAQASKLATLGTMAAGIAHEMSQPLNAIRITATDCVLLLEEEEEPDMGYLRQGLVTIRDQSARMGGIVDQMRQFGRRESPEPSGFDPGEPVRLAAGLMAGQFTAAGIQLSTDIAHPLPPVIGHAGKLQQVIINLLSNARDAIEERRRADGGAADGGAGGGSVSGGGAGPGLIRVTATPAPSGRGIVIAVEDDGIGLSPGAAERIFDPFFTTKDSDKGMGLGLSISASIVGAMGGRIEAMPGASGARFVITLPVRQNALGAAQ